MTKWRMARSGIILALLLFGGCSGRPDKAGDAGRTDPVTLVPVSFDVWQGKLASYKGDIVVVDNWATWCVPCVERFPHMVELYQKYRSKGVRFISMCLDDRDDPDALRRAEQFLVAQHATFENYRMDEVVPDAFEKLDLLGIPAVFVYDRSGKLRYRLTGDDPNHQFTDADVEGAIEKLLAMKPEA